MSGRPEAQALLEEASAARGRMDGRGCLQALIEACRLATDLQELAAWRLAKAAVDFDDLSALRQALLLINQQERPFERYPEGLRAVEPLSRRWWDQVGYADDLASPLWQAWVAHYRRVGDPFLAALGEVNALWPQACRGDVGDLRQALERWSALNPRSFGHGPHRHPSAPDTASSVYWVQTDVARTVLWAATWKGDEKLAWDALELAEDAAEATEADRLGQFWFLDPIVRAGLRFRWTKPVGHYLQAWRRAAESLTQAQRRAVHLPLVQGDLHREAVEPESALRSYLEAARASEAANAGAEWTLDALTCALECGANVQPSIDHLVRERGVTAFRGRQHPRAGGHHADPLVVDDRGVRGNP